MSYLGNTEPEALGYLLWVPQQQIVMRAPLCLNKTCVMYDFPHKVSQDLAFFFFFSKGEIETDVSMKRQAGDKSEDADVDVIDADQVISDWVFQLCGQLYLGWVNMSSEPREYPPGCRAAPFRLRKEVLSSSLSSCV